MGAAPRGGRRATARAEAVTRSQRIALLVAALVAMRVAMPLVFLDPTWEYHRDELLYFAMSDHLAWQMQFPPLVPFVAKLSAMVFGDSVWAARVPAAIAGGFLTLAVLVLVRRLGGGRWAIVLAWLALAAAPVFVRPSVLFHPVVFDQLWATIAVGALILAATERTPRWWLVVGAAFGLGLLTKFAVLMYGAVVFVLALAHPTLREQLKTKWPWLAGAIAAVVGLPSLLGQIRYDWPFLRSLEALKAGQFEATSLSTTLSDQVLMLAGAFLLVLAGVAVAVRASDPYRDLRRPARLALGFVVGLLVLVLWQGGKEYYVAPAYPVLIAVGAIAVARLKYVAARAGLALVLAASAVMLRPMGIPTLAPDAMAAYSAKLGMGTTANWGEKLDLPQDYADMLGWRAQAEAMSRAYAALSPEDQAAVIIWGGNYGQAGALARYAARHGYPYPVSLSGDFHAWGLYGRKGTVILLLAGPEAADQLAQGFEQVQVVATLGNPRAVPEERNLRIFLARGPRMDLAMVWQQMGANWD